MPTSFAGVIYDEFNGDVPASCFLKWIDQYPIKVKVYHAEKQLCTTHSIVISNVHPTKIYAKLPIERRIAFLSRFTFFKVSGESEEACVARTNTATFIQKMKLQRVNHNWKLVPVWSQPRRAGCSNPDAVLFEA